MFSRSCSCFHSRLPPIGPAKDFHLQSLRHARRTASLRGSAASLCPGLICCSPCGAKNVWAAGRSHRVEHHVQGLQDRGGQRRVPLAGRGWHRSSRSWSGRSPRQLAGQVLCPSGATHTSLGQSEAAEPRSVAPGRQGQDTSVEAMGASQAAVCRDRNRRRVDSFVTRSVPGWCRRLPPHGLSPPVPTDAC